MIVKVLFSLCLFISTLTVAATKPADGVWRTTEDPDVGSGVVLTTQGEVTVANVFTYAPDGQPEWYLAAGSVNADGVFSAPLLKAVNGSYLASQSPVSAEFSGPGRTLELVFMGSQSATISIDGSAVQAMQPLHFGYPVFATDHHHLADGTAAYVADLAGTWVLGDGKTDESHVLDLVRQDDQAGTSKTAITYLSQHPETQGWRVTCPWQIRDFTTPFIQPHCVLDDTFELPDLRIEFADLGQRVMQLNSVDDQVQLTARRVVDRQHQLPAYGLWRPENDPAVGSGLVMITQGDMSLLMVYSYNAQGQPEWQIATGQFDQSGYLEVPLYRATGGVPIELNGHTSAQYMDSEHTLKVQLEGAELATFRINDSEPLYLQNTYFGVGSHTTESFMPAGKAYQFADITGRWVVYDRSVEPTRAYVLNMLNNPLSGSAADNEVVFSGQFTSQRDGDPEAVEVVCQQALLNAGETYCAASLVFAGQQRVDSKVRFQDMGYERFRMYRDQGGVSWLDQPDYLEFIRID